MTPLVLLHGFTGAPASWDAVVRALGTETGVHRETLAGHGHPRLDTAEDFEGEVDRVARCIQRERIAGAHLVGYSLGARVALGLLVRHRRLFSRATLVSVHPGLTSEEARARRRRDDEEWIHLLGEGIAGFVSVWEGQRLFSPHRPLDPDVLARQRAIRLAHRAEGLARSLRVLGLAGMPDYTRALPSIDTPVTLIAGLLDSKFARLARQAAALLPRCAVHLAESGHNVPLEQPRALARLLRDPSPSPEESHP